MREACGAGPLIWVVNVIFPIREIRDIRGQNSPLLE
jgi:hypothetical protein